MTIEEEIASLQSAARTDPKAFYGTAKGKSVGAGVVRVRELISRLEAAIVEIRPLNRY